MFSEFLLKLLDRVSPVDRLGRLSVIGDVFADGGSEGIGCEKVIGLQAFTSQQTEPDFDLVQPGGIGGNKYT